MDHTASLLASELRRLRLRIVFAESCTAGRASAQLATVPGISAQLCGSWVTYREASKQDWLGVEATLLRDHSAVSAPVTQAMAWGALQRTHEADLAAAITGHFGPATPSDLDGVCFLTLVTRQQESGHLAAAKRIELPRVTRTERQAMAARSLLRFVADHLQQIG